MNNKEFLAELSSRLNMNAKTTGQIMTALNEEITSHLEEEDSISIQGFGIFEVKKKLERVLVNPSSKQRMLVPPKMVVNFKVSNVLKDKIQDL